MKKYLAGGRCGGGSSGSEQKDSQGTNQAFQQMLAARDAQVSNLWKPVQPEVTQEKKTIPFTQTQQQPQTRCKKEDIKLILGRND
jgi:hypothetical protein